MTAWKNCSSCKREIPYGANYYQCSVSTCKNPRTGMSFCSVECWDAHLGYANHREAWAEEAKAPLSATDRPPTRKIIENTPSPATSTSTGGNSTNIETDTLVVVSKVKKLVQDQSGMNTSQCFIDALTKKVIKECLTGITKARADGRKTVMGKDIWSSS